MSAGRPPGLWILDLETGNPPRQLTFDRLADAPVWSHDSATAYFRSSVSSQVGVYSVDADGGEPELIAPAPIEFPTAFPWSLTADGETLLALNVVTRNDAEIAALGLGAERTFRELLKDASLPALSPSSMIRKTTTRLRLLNDNASIPS